jgi:hypothetical protein
MNPKEQRARHTAVQRLRAEMMEWVRMSDQRAINLTMPLRRGFFGRLKWLLLGR